MNQVYTHRQLQTYVDAVATLPRIDAFTDGDVVLTRGSLRGGTARAGLHNRPAEAMLPSVFCMSSYRSRWVFFVPRLAQQPVKFLHAVAESVLKSSLVNAEHQDVEAQDTEEN